MEDPLPLEDHLRERLCVFGFVHLLRQAALRPGSSGTILVAPKLAY